MKSMLLQLVYKHVQPIPNLSHMDEELSMSQNLMPAQARKENHKYVLKASLDLSAWVSYLVVLLTQYKARSLKVYYDHKCGDKVFL